MQIIGSTKCLQSIAGFIVERDSEIRKAALSTLAVSYKVLGSHLKIFKTHMNPCISWLPFRHFGCGITYMLLKMLLMKWCCFISKFLFWFLDLTFVFLQVMTFGGLLENCLVHRREYWMKSSSGRSV